MFAVQLDTRHRNDSALTVQELIMKVLGLNRFGRNVLPAQIKLFLSSVFWGPSWVRGSGFRDISWKLSGSCVLVLLGS